MKYEITFDDGIIYTSPNVFEKDPGWYSELDQKKTGIRQISIKIPGTNKAILLKGFDAYNFFIEATQTLGGASTKIQNLWFCGRWRNHVVSYIFNIENQQIGKKSAVNGKEFHGSATRGWRKGLLNGSPKNGIITI